MSEEEVEVLRERIWDHLFHHGQQSVDDLAEQLGLTSQEVLESIDYEWFVVENQQVFIATGGN